MNTSTVHDVVIIGAGFSGIGASIKLSQAGFHDHILIEDATEVGGTWHWNTYPGVAVDIPSQSYQFSFEAHSDWSRIYAPGDELLAYATSLADKHDVRRRTQFETRALSARFDETTSEWTLDLSPGTTVRARHIILATGVLTQPKSPDIKGIEDFMGTVVHTSRWDHNVKLRGKRVGVIGTGASAVQLIPSIAETVDHLTVFQRTPIWCLPKPDAPIRPALRKVVQRVPGLRRLVRLITQTYVEVTFPLAAHFHSLLPSARVGEYIARRHLRRSVHNEDTRRLLTPEYAMGCKRPSFSNTYLPTFNRPDVTLETSAIDRVTATGIISDNGIEHPIDVLVLATGFKVFEEGNSPSLKINAPDGRELGSWWAQNRYRSYQGVSVPGFPNVFNIAGPYGYNGASYFTLIESQVAHILRCLTEERRRGTTQVEITQKAHDAYMETMLGRGHRQVFWDSSCGSANSYYFDPHGDVPFRASPTVEVMWTSNHFSLDSYRFTLSKPQT